MQHGIGIGHIYSRHTIQESWRESEHEAAYHFVGTAWDSQGIKAVTAVLFIFAKQWGVFPFVLVGPCATVGSTLDPIGLFINTWVSATQEWVIPVHRRCSYDNPACFCLSGLVVDSCGYRVVRQAAYFTYIAMLYSSSPWLQSKVPISVLVRTGVNNNTRKMLLISTEGGGGGGR